MRLAVPDLISPSYFPAIAAVELGLLRNEGLDVEMELVFPVTDAVAALREGKIDILAGAAHAPLYAFPQWAGVKLIAALSQKMYWFLVVRGDLDVDAGNVSALQGLRIGAAPGPDVGLVQLLQEAGVDVEQSNIWIGPVEGSDRSSVSFGLTAAEALADGRVDAFWANGMGAEVAVRRGVGKVVVDARRGKVPPSASSYTFPAIMATEAMIEGDPEAVAAVVRGVVAAQTILVENPGRATEVGRRLFPPMEAQLIRELIRRDIPFYTAGISEEAVSSLNAFARRAGLLRGQVFYDDVVAKRFRAFWQVDRFPENPGKKAIDD